MRLGQSDLNSEVTLLAVLMSHAFMEIIWDCLGVTMVVRWLYYRGDHKSMFACTVSLNQYNKPFSSQLEGEEEESGESGAEGEGKTETTQVYKPPKLAAMHYGKSSSMLYISSLWQCLSVCAVIFLSVSHVCG